MLYYIIGFALPLVLMLRRQSIVNQSSSQLINDQNMQLKSFDNFTIVVTSIYIFLLSALRNVCIGADTDAYVAWFLNAPTYKLNLATGRAVEKGFMVFQYLCTFITKSPQVYLGIIALIVGIVVARFVKKYSSNPACSMFLYMVYLFQFYGLTGIRQTLAGMVLLLSYDCVRKRKLIPFLLLVALAVSFHNSAIIFLPYYFFANKEITKNYIIVIFSAFVLFFAFRNQVMQLLTHSFVSLTGDDYYSVYSSSAFTILNYVLMVVALVILTLSRKESILENNPVTVQYFNAILIAMVFAPTGNTRTMQYYWIFIILLFPEYMNAVQDQDKFIVKYGIPFILALLMLRSYAGYPAITPYKFFWQ